MSPRRIREITYSFYILDGEIHTIFFAKLIVAFAWNDLRKLEYIAEQG